MEFVRIRGSIFFRDEERAMRPMFERLENLGIAPELVQVSEDHATTDSLTERVIARAQELRREWSESRPEVLQESPDAKPRGRSWARAAGRKA